MKFEVQGHMYDVKPHARMDEYAGKNYAVPRKKNMSKAHQYNDAMLHILIGVMMLKTDAIAKYIDCVLSQNDTTSRPKLRAITEAVESLELRGGSMSQTASMIYFDLAQDEKTTLLQRLNSLLCIMQAVNSKSRTPDIELIYTYKTLSQQKQNFDDFVDLMRNAPTIYRQ